jgi:D-amino-acid dehydrogenase
LPWLIRFALESRPSRVSRNAVNLHALTSLAVQGWRQLTDNTELGGLLHDKGWLKVYESERSFDATANARQLMDKIGTPYEILSEGEIQDIEPRLAPIFNRGILQRDCLNIINPQRMVQGMVELFVRRGGTYRQFDVRNVDITEGEVRLRNSQAVVSADKVVIATGAWSRSLASQVGDNVPLDTERGYHLMLPMGSRDLLSRPVVNGEASFVLSPMESGLRMTSQVELGGLDCEPDFSRVRSLLTVVKRMLPDVDTTEQSVWMGFRPSLPDSLPVLGFSPNTDKVLYAFGHQHLGMTMGPISGLIIADLVAGRKPLVDLAPYRADRF